MSADWDLRSPEVVDVAISSLRLTSGERQLLAVWARYESQKQEDFRYQLGDPTARAYWLKRWREIADAFHPDPWGSEATR